MRKPFYLWFLQSAACFAFAAVLATTPAYAQDDDDDDDDDDDEVVEEVEEISPDQLCNQAIYDSMEAIKQKWSQKAVLNEVRNKAFARATSKVQFPNFLLLRHMDWEKLQVKRADSTLDLISNMKTVNPKESKEDLYKRVCEECEQQVSEEFKMEQQIEKLMKDAEKKYSLYRKGDKVSLVLRKGKGPGARLDNVVFKDIYEDRIVFTNGRAVNRIDLDKDVIARFDPDLNAKVKQEFIDNGIERLKRDKGIQIEIAVRKHIPQAYKEAGYIPNILDTDEDANWTNTKMGKWTTLDEFITKLQTIYIEREKRNSLFTDVQRRMGAQGYTVDNLDANANGQNGMDQYGMGPGMMGPGMMGPGMNSTTDPSAIQLDKFDNNRLAVKGGKMFYLCQELDTKLYFFAVQNVQEVGTSSNAQRLEWVNDAILEKRKAASQPQDPYGMGPGMGPGMGGPGMPPTGM